MLVVLGERVPQNWPIQNTGMDGSEGLIHDLYYEETTRRDQEHMCMIAFLTAEFIPPALVALDLKKNIQMVYSVCPRHINTKKAPV
jgi:hypothetical protein